jgi:hypothetical protein
MLVLDRAYADLGKEVGADLLTLIERVESASLEEPFGDRLRRAAEEIEKGRNVHA